MENLILYGAGTFVLFIFVLVYFAEIYDKNESLFYNMGVLLGGILLTILIAVFFVVFCAGLKHLHWI